MDKQQRQNRFEQFEPPRRIASIASSVNHVFLYEKNHPGSQLDDNPQRMLDDALLYIEWTKPVVETSLKAELIELSRLITDWQQNWQEFWHTPSGRTTVVKQCKQWSDKLIEASGLAKLHI